MDKVMHPSSDENLRGMTLANGQSDCAPPRLNLRVLGVPVSVVFDRGITGIHVSRLRRAWSRCVDELGGVDCVSGDDVAGSYGRRKVAKYAARLIGRAGAWAVVADTAEEFDAELTSALTLYGIESRRGELLMLHASGIADPGSGRTVALVGPSGAGKTTATRVLAEGYSYVTDETVAIDRDGKLTPYAKPLSFIAGTSTEPKRQIGPDELGLRHSPDEAVIAAVILLDRASLTGDAPRIESLSHAEALMQLVPHTSSLAGTMQPLQWLCSVLDKCGGAFRVTYDEASELKPLLPGLLSRSSTDGGWAAADASTVSGGSHRQGLFRRGMVVDAVEMLAPDGEPFELVVMKDHRVIRLGGVAPAIWRAVRSPQTLDAISDQIGGRLGSPGRGIETAAHAVAVLEAEGLLIQT
jgi:hypothetical protein